MLNQNRSCSKCLIVSGTLVQICQYCEEQLNFYDENLEGEEQATRSQLITSIQSNNQIHQQFQKKAKLKSKQQLIFDKSGDLLIPELKTKQYQYIKGIIEKALHKNLIGYIRHYKDQQPYSFRGPADIAGIENMRRYKKPEGFYGFPIQVEVGPWIGKNGNQHEWFVAYKKGPFQIKNYFKNQINKNPLSFSEAVQDKYVGSGISCYGNIQTAIQKQYLYQKQYQIVMQCRINPYRAKLVSNNGYRPQYVINDPSDIVAYRVLVSKKSKNGNR